MRGREREGGGGKEQIDIRIDYMYTYKHTPIKPNA